MTDVIALTNRLYRAIKWQEVPETVPREELIELIVDAIEYLYVLSGRNRMYSEDMYTDTQEQEDPEQESYPGLFFQDDLSPAEKRIVLLKAQVEFYKMVQASHDDDTSYTTDAMSVTHGDKPYEHIGATIDRLEKDLAVMWTRLVEYNQLGVSG